MLLSQLLRVSVTRTGSGLPKQLRGVQWSTVIRRSNTVAQRNSSNFRQRATGARLSTFSFSPFRIRHRRTALTGTKTTTTTTATNSAPKALFGLQSGVRLLSTEVNKTGAQAGQAWYQNTLLRHGLVAATVVGALTYGAYNFTAWVMSFNSKYWLYLGFLGGVTFAALSGSAGIYLWRNITILPENVFRYAVSVLKNNAYVKKTLGTVKPSYLKAYKLEHGFVGFRDRRFQWFSPNVQMMFLVNQSGSNASPMVAYVDAERTFSGLQLRNVALLTKDPEHGFKEPNIIQVIGTNDDIEKRAHLQKQLFASKGHCVRDIPHFEV